MMSGLGPRNNVLRGGDFGENVPDKPNTFMNCELDWSMQRRAHDVGRRLIASIERVLLSATKGEGGVAHRRRSL